MGGFYTYLSIRAEHKGDVLGVEIQPRLDAITGPKEGVQGRGLALPRGRPGEIDDLTVERAREAVGRFVSEVPDQVPVGCGREKRWVRGWMNERATERGREREEETCDPPTLLPKFSLRYSEESKEGGPMAYTLPAHTSVISKASGLERCWAPREERREEGEEVVEVGRREEGEEEAAGALLREERRMGEEEEEDVGGWVSPVPKEERRLLLPGEEAGGEEEEGCAGGEEEEEEEGAAEAA